MKVKHIMFYHILVVIILLLVWLTGCKKSELEQRIIAWQTTYPDRKGDCGIYAMKAKAYHERKGRRARMCHGYWRGKPHAWCEYESGGRWLVDDKAIGNKGYERDSYGDYTLVWYGE